MPGGRTPAPLICMMFMNTVLSQELMPPVSFKSRSPFLMKYLSALRL